MKARVTVTLKSGILDPQGKAIEGALKSLGIAGARPLTSWSARAMSRSRLMPGKTTTADFITARAPARPSAAPDPR